MPPYPLESFREADYRQLISAFQRLGYKDVSLHELVPDQPHMFVRHDVDLSLEHALRLGILEAELCIKSTFYFLISTSFYNLASAPSRRMIAELISLGHTVALHFDATAYSGDRAGLERQAEEECRILEQLTAQTVTSISFHRPVKEFLNMSGTFAGRRHTYEPQFFSDIGYISDSNGGWGHGHPLDHPSVTVRRGIQLLTHPIWWMNIDRTDPIGVIEGLRRDRSAADRHMLADTVTRYKDWLAPPDKSSFSSD